MLGLALSQTPSIPMGSIKKVRMYPLDFEEFYWANGVGNLVVKTMKENFKQKQSLNESIHQTIMKLFRLYLLIGGMSAAVNSYLEKYNIQLVRKIQNEIHEYYTIDASNYEKDAKTKLKIRRIYDLIPSNMENKKKRLRANKIENRQAKLIRIPRGI